MTLIANGQHRRSLGERFGFADGIDDEGERADTDNTVVEGGGSERSELGLPSRLSRQFLPNRDAEPPRPEEKERTTTRKGTEGGTTGREVSQSFALTAKRATIAAITLSRRESEPNLLGFLITALVANRSILSFCAAGRSRVGLCQSSAGRREEERDARV